MSIDKEPLAPILIRFQQDLQLNGLKERSQQSYVRNVRMFSEFLKCDPNAASEEDLRRYLLYIKNDAHWSSSTINVAQQALKKFFSITCPQTWATLNLVRARGELKLPFVISIGEVHTLLKLIEKPSMLCYFTGPFGPFTRINASHPKGLLQNPSQQEMDFPSRGKKPLASPNCRQAHERFFRSGCYQGGHCPVCQGGKAKAWLQNQLGQLLPCAYFMLTFTVSAEFRMFMRSHPRECYKALFEAAKETRFALAKDPKYIGSGGPHPAFGTLPPRGRRGL